MAKFPLSSFKAVGGLLFISGQIGQKDGTLVSEDLEQQIIQAIANIREILNQNNLNLKNIVDVTAFLIDENDYTPFNEVYKNSLEEPYPTRTTVTVRALPLGARVELKAVAMRD